MVRPVPTDISHPYYGVYCPKIFKDLLLTSLLMGDISLEWVNDCISTKKLVWGIRQASAFSKTILLSDNPHNKTLPCIMYHSLLVPNSSRTILGRANAKGSWEPHK